MDPEENSSASFIPEHLQKILNVIESGETRHKWKLVRNAASFTLIINFPAKTDKGQGQGNHPPLKKRASGVLTCQHKDKKIASSDVRPADHPKPKKKKTPSRVARDRRRRREFWKRMKVARQLRAENLAAHYARLQETRKVASPQSPAVSHSENSKCRLDRNSPESRRIASPQSPVVRHSEESGCLDRTPLVSESHSRLTIEKQTSIHSDLLNELSAEEAETDKSVIPDSDDSQFEKCLLNRIPEVEQDIESPNSCSNCLAEGNFQKCSACRYVRYCSKKCQAEDWPSHKQLCKAIRTLPRVEECL